MSVEYNADLVLRYDKFSIGKNLVIVRFLERDYMITNSLRKKIVGLVVVSLIISLGVYSILLYINLKNIIVANQEEHISSLAVAYCREISLWLDAKKLEISAVADSVSLMDGNYTAIRGRLKRHAKRNPTYEMLFYADTKGNSFSSSDFKANIVDRVYFQQVLNTGKEIVSDPLISRQSNNPIIAIAVPVKKGNLITGVVGCTISLNYLSELISHIRPVDTGYAFVIQEDGTTIFHPDKQLILKHNILKDPHIDPSLKDAVNKMVNRQTGLTTYVYENTIKYLAYAPIQGTNWSLAINAPAYEVLKQLSPIKRLIIIIPVFVVVLASILISFLLIIFIVRPITALKNAMDRVETGDLDVQAYYNSRDEIGQLTDSFNLMIQTIKQGREAIQKSEEKYRSLFENASEAIFVIQDQKMILANAVLSRFTGYSTEELTSRPFVDFIHPEDREMVFERYQKHLKGDDAPHTYSFRIIDKKGHILWGEVNSIVIDWEGEKAALCFLMDITERKQAEDIVKLNAQRTETLLRLNQMAEAPLKEITDYALEEAVRITKSTIGYLAFVNEDESVLTMNSWSNNAMNECAIAQKPLRYNVSETGLWGEAIRQRKPIVTNDYNAPNPLKKGYPKSHIPILRHMNVPIFADSKIVLVAGVGNKKEEYDLTDVQQLTLLMEGMWRLIERKRTSEEFLKEREKLQTLSDNAPFGMILIDKEGHFTYINKKITDLFGYTISDIPNGRTWFRKAYPDREYRHNVIANWLDNLENRNPTQLKPIIFNVTCKDGTQKVISFANAVLASGNYLMTCEDITELRHLENQLRQAQKMEAIGTLAGGIAHDFNNILTALMGYTTLMQFKMEAGSPLQPYVNQILSASKKASDLIGSLLAFSRKQPITLAPVDINRIIGETEKLLRRLLTDDIELRTSFTEESTTVMADKSQIDQILFNLTTNARDAMPNGGTLTIETSLVFIDDNFVKTEGFGIHGRYVKISVSDTGIGMDAATMDNIFDPFFTTKEVGKGTGLGLATVYGIVKQHNGYITVNSMLNRGTTFHIYLPSVKVIVDENHDKSTTIKTGKETILIAEDNEDVRTFMSEALQQLGYKILQATDGEVAVEMFRQHQDIDLVIIDSVMPKKNGREVYHAIHNINPHIKALFTSGYTKDIILDKGIEEKEVDFIAKPLSLDAFISKVREVLDRT